MESSRLRKGQMFRRVLEASLWLFCRGRSGEGRAGGRLRRLTDALMREDEALGSGLGRGEGGKGANCRTCSIFLQG